MWSFIQVIFGPKYWDSIQDSPLLLEEIVVNSWGVSILDSPLLLEIFVNSWGVNLGVLQAQHISIS